MATERSFIMVKPEGVERGLVGKIIKRFEQKGLKLVALKFMQPTLRLLEEHYVEHKTEEWFVALTEFMSSGPVVAMVWEGLGVVKTGRKMLGVAAPAGCGSIRGDFCVHIGLNTCHGSDSVEMAEREISLWFNPEELVEWKPSPYQWLYE